MKIVLNALEIACFYSHKVLPRAEDSPHKALMRIVSLKEYDYQEVNISSLFIIYNS
jgi:hypothetical protein